jgi:hypothetical protein
LIDSTELQALLGKDDETPTIEFKLKYVLTGPDRGKFLDEIAKDLLSLVNTAGRTKDDYAYLIIGAGDKLKPGRVRDKDDVRPYGYSKQQFLNIVNARCVPPVPELNYAAVEAGGNFYGVVEIPPSPYVHELSRNLDTPKGGWPQGCVLIRRGETVGAASPRELVQMEQEKSSWRLPPAPTSAQLEEYLFDVAKRPKVRELVIGEAKRLQTSLSDPEFHKKHIGGDYVSLIALMAEYERLTDEFLPLLITGCYHAEEWFEQVWPEALSIIADVEEPRGASQRMSRLRRYPALLGLYAGGMASIAAGRYGNLAALMRRTQVKSYGNHNEVTFGLAWGRIVSPDDEKQLRRHDLLGRRFYNHVAFVVSSPLGKFIHDDTRMRECQVRFEYLLALLSETQKNGLLVGGYLDEDEQMRGFQTSWQTRVPVIKETDEELDQLKENWPPLKSGLFTEPLVVFREFKSEVDGAILKKAETYILGG